MSAPPPPEAPPRPAPSLRAQIISALIGGAGVRLAGVAVTFLVGVQLARYLGPAEYGVYGTVIAVTSIFAAVAQVGLSPLLTRELAQIGSTEGNARGRAALVYFFGVVVGLSLLAMAAFVIGSAIWPKMAMGLSGTALLVSAGLIPVTALLNMAGGALRGLNHPVAAQSQDALFRPAIFAAVLFAAASWSVPLDSRRAIELQVAVGVCAVVAYLALLYVWTPDVVKAAHPRPEKARWTSAALSMGATEILRIVEGQYALLIVGALTTPSEVGYFRVAMAAAAFVALPASLMNTMLIQNLAILFYNRKLEQLSKLLGYSSLVSLITTIFGAFTIYFVGQDLIVVIFGAKFAGAWEPLFILCLAYVVMAWVGCGQSLLYMCEQEKALSRIIAATLLIGFLVTILLVPHFGAAGAAWGAVAMYLVRSALIWTVAQKRIGVDASPVTIIQARL